MPKHNLVWTNVDSSNVQSVAYDDHTKTLCVRFLNGGLYSYNDVSHEVYTDLVHAESVGRYLNKYVKGFCSYTRFSSVQELEESLR